MWHKIQYYIIIVACLVEAEDFKIPANMLSELQRELSYESILLMKHSEESYWIDMNMEFPVPVINLNEKRGYKLEDIFPKRFLALVCLDKRRDDIINRLYRNLENMRATTTIFLIEDPININDILYDCFRNKMLNVLAWSNASREYIYSYRAFPQYKLVERRIDLIQRYFEPQLRNMGNHPITTIPDNVLPRTVVYKDKKGYRQMTGYLVPFLRNFAKSLNGKLKICWNCLPSNISAEFTSWETTKALMRNGTVDIPLFLINMRGISKQFLNSHVMEISKWQLMLPMEPEVKRGILIFNFANRLHFILIVVVMWLLGLLINNAHLLEMGQPPSLRFVLQMIDPILRAVVYQTFMLRNGLSFRLMYIYWLLLMFSFLSYNIYITQLEMMLVHPPTKRAIRSYQHLREEGLKILISSNDKKALEISYAGHVLHSNRDIFKLVNSSYFQNMRSQPNSAYAYPITHTLWPLIERKFVKQPKPIFRLSKDFIFLSFVPFILPLPKNSIFLDALNHYILNTHCSGLYSHWFARGFHKLAAIGKMEILPFDPLHDSPHIHWEDFCFIWVSYIGLILICLLTFVSELLYFYLKSRRIIREII